jgi:hypothetical protein
MFNSDYGGFSVSASSSNNDANTPYVALVDGATINVPFLSNGTSNNTLSSSRTAITLTVSSDTNAAEAYIVLTKTTPSDLVLTFPANTSITDQNGNDAGTGVLFTTLNSTSSGKFEIYIKKIPSGYRAIIKRFVA